VGFWQPVRHLVQLLSEKQLLSVLEVLGQAVRPIPYYIVAIVLLVVFAYLIPILPFSGAYRSGLIQAGHLTSP